MLRHITTKLPAVGLLATLSMCLVACSAANTDDNIDYLPVDPWAQPTDSTTATPNDVSAIGTEKGTRTLVASYEGVLPAASAEGIQYTISFYDDNTFQLERVYLGRPESMDNTFTDEGEYEIAMGFDGDPAAKRYVIHPKDEFNRTGFLIQNDNTILMLDRQQRIIETDIDYALTRTAP